MTSPHGLQQPLSLAALPRERAVTTNPATGIMQAEADPSTQVLSVSATRGGLAAGSQSYPHARVMSPSGRASSSVAVPWRCADNPMHGPVVGCASCTQLVHPQCIVALCHETYCEVC